MICQLEVRDTIDISTENENEDEDCDAVVGSTYSVRDTIDISTENENEDCDAVVGSTYSVPRSIRQTRTVLCEVIVDAIAQLHREINFKNIDSRRMWLINCILEKHTDVVDGVQQYEMEYIL